MAREVVEHGREVHPAPPDDLEVGEVGLPHLVRAGSLGVELIGGLYHDIGRTGVQIVRLEQARSEEHTSELQSLMRISYAVFCLKKKKNLSLLFFYLYLLSMNYNT